MCFVYSDRCEPAPSKAESFLKTQTALRTVCPSRRGLSDAEKYHTDSDENYKRTVDK